MEWQKLYTALRNKRKWIRLSLAAKGLWTECKLWVGEEESGGLIPAEIVEHYGGHDWSALADSLVLSGLWERTPDGFAMHDYAVAQEAILRARGQAATRKQRQRDNTNSHASVTRDTQGTPDGVPHFPSYSESDSEIPVTQNVGKGTVAREDVQLVFDTWCSTLQGASRELTQGRRAKIAARLRRYPVDDVVDAVRGWTRDTWAERRRHNDITVLLRSDETCEAWRDAWRDGLTGGKDWTPVSDGMRAKGIDPETGAPLSAIAQ